MVDFFVSYASPDRDRAEWVARQLEEAGHTTVVQAWDFRPGHDFVHLMQVATTTAARTIAVASPDYFRSAFTEAEWRAAFVQDPSGDRGLLLLVVVRPCTVPGLLASRIHIDLTDLTEGDARQRLLDGVAPGRLRPELAVPYGSPAPSTYREQVVRSLAPRELVDRAVELAELAAFCTRPGRDRPDYLCWRGPAWSGKSALLSWFVLHPPSGIRVVSFFITARLAGQNDRAAFLDTILDQLFEVAGTSGPVSAAQARFGELLVTAAERCVRAGERLILVVDGLDEDSGLSPLGYDTYSIAGLLPGALPAGMRVIASSRPNPPLAVDVDPGHPLHDPGNVRELTPSRHAAAVELDATRDLKRLLHGSLVERELLGLLTAAKGGLTGLDLTELVNLSATAGEVEQWVVEDALNSVSGRIFDRLGAGYFLAHEDLYRAAATFLTRALDRYRQRLHDWCDRYRSAGWPNETPEYLLQGYFRLLGEAGNVDRQVALALDRARHRRLYEHTGGDSAAESEIRSSQHQLLNRGDGELYHLSRLSHLRSHLSVRNSHIPAELPAVWVVLGRPARAEAMARSMSVDWQRSAALSEVAQALARTGELARAERVAAEIPVYYSRVEAIAKIAEAAAANGDHDLAFRLNSVADRDGRMRYDQHERCLSASEIVLPVARSGDHDRARRLVIDICTLTHDTGPVSRAWFRSRAAAAAAEVGDADHARQLLDEVEVHAHTLANDPGLEFRLQAVVDAVIQAGDIDRAWRVARMPPKPHHRVDILAQAAMTAAERGKQEASRAFAEEALRDASRATAEKTERTETMDPESCVGASTLAYLAHAAVTAGDQARARRLITLAGQRDLGTGTMATIAVVTAKLGDHREASRIAIDAETIARGPDHNLGGWATLRVATAVAETPAYERALPFVDGGFFRVLETCARAIAAAGEQDRAVELARSAGDPTVRARALTWVALTMVGAGRHREARRLIVDAEELARRTQDHVSRAELFADLARAAAAAGDGDLDQARRLLIDGERNVKVIRDSAGKARALAFLAGAAGRAGQAERASRLVTEAEQWGRSVEEMKERAQVLACVAGAAAEAGDQETVRRLMPDADFVADVTSDSQLQQDALFALLDAAGRPGADALLARAITMGMWPTALPALARRHPDVALRLVDELFPELV